MKVVGVARGVKRTPTGVERERLCKDIWVRATSSEEDMCEKIREALGWSPRQPIEFLYAQGRNLRIATLADVEGAQG